MMTIDTELLRALQKVMGEFKNPYRMSKAIKISHTTIMRWLDGETKTIDSNIMLKLIPYIEPFLQENYIQNKIPDKMLLELFMLARTKRLAIASKEFSEIKYKQLFDFSPDPIFVADSITRQLVDCNKIALEITGFTKEKILCMKADDLHSEPVRQKTMKVFREHIEYGTEIHYKTDLITRDGRKIPVLIKGGLCPVEQGNSLMIGIFRIISDYY